MPVILLLPVLPEVVSLSAEPAVEGQNLTLNCNGTGYPVPTYWWLRLDDVLPSRAVGVNSSALTITNVSQNDVGQYACVAVNNRGTNQSWAITPLIYLTSAGAY